MHRNKTLMLGHGKYAEGMTQTLINDMQYSAANKVDRRWLFAIHDATEEDLEIEERAHYHACRKTAAVNDAHIKVLSGVLQDSFPPNQDEHQKLMKNIDGLVWIGANYIWRMVENIEKWVNMSTHQRQKASVQRC